MAGHLPAFCVCGMWQLVPSPSLMQWTWLICIIGKLDLQNIQACLGFSIHAWLIAIVMIIAHGLHQY